MDEDEFSNLTYETYVSVRRVNVTDDFQYDLVADIDDVIRAGIEALGLEEDFIFVETSMKDSDW